MKEQLEKYLSKETMKALDSLVNRGWYTWDTMRRLEIKYGDRAEFVIDGKLMMYTKDNVRYYDHTDSLI